jgi:hypothetical protein
MEKQNFLTSKKFKFILPLAILVIVIQVAKSGYIFGQWLQNTLN